jgi:predicted ATPase
VGGFSADRPPLTLASPPIENGAYNVQSSDKHYNLNMIREIGFENWKSFRKANLELAELSVLIGTNASGKSNALDGVEFLAQSARGRDLSHILAGDSTDKGIRGGIEWASQIGCDTFALSCKIATDDTRISYLYRIEVRTRPRVELESESLSRIIEPTKQQRSQVPAERKLYWTDNARLDSASMTARVYNKKRGVPPPRECRRSISVLSQLESSKMPEDVGGAVSLVLASLRGTFFLDPSPVLMRAYSRLSSSLENTGANTAGVLAGLPDAEREETLKKLTECAQILPARDIKKIYVEKVGKFESDAMLYCAEDWMVKGKQTEVDSRGMSDGTLRFIAIATALLTRPQGSLLMIEEIDNGLHPSRAQVLLKMLLRIGVERKIQILLTTHSPAFLDALAPENVRNVVVTLRDVESGCSNFGFLKDLESLYKVLAQQSFGGAVAAGLMEKSFNDQFELGLDR